MEITAALAAILLLLILPLTSIAQDRPEDEFKIEPGRSASEYYNIGNWYAEREQHYRAIAYYKAAIAKDEEFTAAWVNMGSAYRAVDRFRDAIRAYKKAIEIGIEENFVYLNLGNAYVGAGELTEATIAFKTFIALEPYDTDGYANLGITLFRLREYAQAADAFEKLLLLDKENAYFMFQAARCYTILGQQDKAFEKLKQALQIDPNIRYALLQDDDFRAFRRSEFYKRLSLELRKN